MPLWNASPDPYQDLRIDIDDMSYEQLLKLCDIIGYENTGLKESDILCCLRNIKPSVFHTLSDSICCICWDGYARRAEVGKLNCGHIFHKDCVKECVLTKNECPVCRETAHVKA